LDPKASLTATTVVLAWIGYKIEIFTLSLLCGSSQRDQSCDLATFYKVAQLHKPRLM